MKKRSSKAATKPASSQNEPAQSQNKPVPGQNNPVPARGGAWQILSILLIVIIVGVVSMPALDYPGDAIAVRFETVQLINTGQWAIPAGIATQMGDKGQYFYYNEGKNAWYPKYGVFNTLMYAPALYLEKEITGRLDYLSNARMPVLNLMNLVLSMFVAVYLFLFVSRYTDSFITRLAFVLSCLYCTYWWFYLRAPTFEIYLVLFFIACCYHLIEAIGRAGGVLASRKQKAHALASAIFLGMLILSKTVYVLLWPLVALVIALIHWWPARGKSGDSFRILWEGTRRCLLWFVIPCGFFAGILLATNDYKFGSPFNTGYYQWAYAQNLFSGNMATAILGYLFNPQFNVPTNFPVLFIALIGMYAFVRSYPRDSFAIGCLALVIVLVNSRFFDWKGLWCYGPRYMLPVLPVLSLPFVIVVDWLRLNTNRGLTWAGAIACFLLLGYSFILQTNVNALNFFTFFYVSEGVIDNLHDPVLDDYFQKEPFGVINGDLLAFKKHGVPLWWRSEVAAKHPAVSEKLDRTLGFVLRSNLMFFPDTPPPQQQKSGAD